ncbi:YggT family protein [Lactobacillus sp. YT155]|uniref:YggT family protein n=1 Tax=Lactobacillus sp. YT155 TaxID=3060955 RepID=UPI00265ED3E7|nr:YggT family protein [Lactobacillus sp. YT155]MDO1605273.1 YggT family protein [Lactobacillus sp. YT155]
MPYVIARLIGAYEVLIIIYALLSWFPGAYRSKLGQILTRMVAPFLNMIDRVVPSIMGMSFAPLIAIILLEILSRILLSIL